VARPAPPSPSLDALQFDLFADSEGTSRRNALADAIAAGHLEAADRELAGLVAHAPDDRLIGPAAMLLQAMHQGLGTPPGPGPASLAVLRDGRCQLEQRLEPAARQVLADRAELWIAARWAWLAGQAEPANYDPASADVHPAALWLAARQPARARAAVAAINSWRRIPIPLGWMLRAELAAGTPAALEAVWPLVAELAWLAPQRLAGLVAERAHAGLTQHGTAFVQRFRGLDGDDDWAWFPAWLLIDEPRLVVLFDGATATTPGEASEAFAVLRALSRLEGQAGRHADRLDHRRRLQALSPVLFADYMALR
jgi:hypothetical protein